MQGEDVFVVARTGAGKLLIFMVTAMAARLAGLDGCLIVVSPLKTLQNDQVSEKSPCYMIMNSQNALWPGNGLERGRQ
jgi:superfamily II DNA helicase RecQ